MTEEEKLFLVLKHNLLPFNSHEEATAFANNVPRHFWAGNENHHYFFNPPQNNYIHKPTGRYLSFSEVYEEVLNELFNCGIDYFDKEFDDVTSI